LQLAGHKEEAQKAFAEFEKKSLREANRADNSNHELIFYYADYRNQPAKALEVARREYARRHDVFTLDCYAWALHVNGHDEEALKQINTAWPSASAMPGCFGILVRSLWRWATARPPNAI